MSIAITQDNFAVVMGQFYDIVKQGLIIEYTIREPKNEMSAYEYVVSGMYKDPAENAFTIDTSDPHWKDAFYIQMKEAPCN